MNKTVFTLLSLCGLLLLASCNDYETYGDKKDKERNAIRNYISREHINVISESVFHAQGDSTSVAKNEYVYMDNTGVYMQIVNRGVGDKLPDGRACDLIIRFHEVGLLDSSYVYNDASPEAYNPDIMNVRRNGNTFTATFTEGTMHDYYGESVPAGWLVPLSYIRVGRPQTTAEADKGVAHVKLIVPHTQGHMSVAQSYVYPYFYDMKLSLTR